MPRFALSVPVTAALAICSIQPTLQAIDSSFMEGPAAIDPQRAGEEFVTAFNSGNLDEMSQFMVDSWADSPSATDAANIAAAILELRQDGGLLESADVQLRDGSRSMHILARRSESGAWQRLQFRLAEATNRVQLVFISNETSPVTLPSTPIDSMETLEWLSGRIKALDAEHPFYGAILIARGDNPFFVTANGLADAESETSNTVRTRFGTASGSKMFTAVALARLVERGDLSFDDKIGKFLPHLQNKRFAESASVRDLLSHNTGIGDYWDDQYEAEWHEITSLEQMLPHVERNLGEPELGSYMYSNSNFILAGLIIEAVTGKDFYTAVREEIFDVVGMNDTDYPIGRTGENVAIGYEPVIETGIVEIGKHLEAELGARGSSAGGASTTVIDMFKFSRALTDGTLISGEMLAELTDAASGRDGFASISYGLGFILGDSDGMASFGHGGSGPGTQFAFSIYPELDLTIVVTSNFNTVAGPELAKEIDQIIRENGVIAT